MPEVALTVAGLKAIKAADIATDAARATRAVDKLEDMGDAARAVDRVERIGNPVNVEGRGSTGRVTPNNLNEQMSMSQIQSNPLQGATEVPIALTDPRWSAAEGWIKMQNVVTLSDGSKSVVHFVYNKVTGAFDDFKFK